MAGNKYLPLPQSGKTFSVWSGHLRPSSLQILFMMIEDSESLFGDDGITLCNLEILFDHFLYQFCKSDTWLPTELFLCPGSVTQQ